MDTTEDGIRTPEGWTALDPDDRRSTIAHFCGGAATDRDGTSAEVLIWHGPEDEQGNIVLESHLGNEPPEDAIYLIEVLDEGELVDELFASADEEAVEKANKQLGELATRLDE